MEKIIEQIKNKILQEIKEVTNQEDINALNTNYLGRKGILSQLLKDIPKMPIDKRPEMGKKLNETKKYLENLFKETLESLENANLSKHEKTDVSLPGRLAFKMGVLHVISQITSEISHIFSKMGFEIAQGPEIELDFYNFEALNIGKDHPARDMHDTFYISENSVLRTHTSPIQVRFMEKNKPPVRIIAPGKVYRSDSDLTHTPMFHQIEGLVVDKNISFGDLKGVLTNFVHNFFDKDTNLRFRPSFFPFTEPSAEVDIQCVICKGKGLNCRVCKQTGWLEVLGSGMVHPKVFQNVNYDTENYTGFAFGMGVERLAMLKYGIDDIRKFFENDFRFLKQF